MATFQIKIKPTSGGPNIIIDTASTRLISDVKQAVTTEASIPATEQRLIYKGQVLKDDRTVESYGDLIALTIASYCTYIQLRFPFCPA